VPLQAALNWPWHAFYFISGDESVKGWGNGEDEARARAALAKRKKGCKENATTAVQKNLEWAWIHGAEALTNFPWSDSSRSYEAMGWEQRQGQ
jgi:hypothetical protein